MTKKNNLSVLKTVFSNWTTAHWIVFGFAIYFVLTSTIGARSVHHFFDPVGIRDMCTVGPHLTWLPQEKLGYWIPVGAMKHLEGPLQFLFLTTYCSWFGNIMPLDPLRMSIPNIFLFLLGGLLLFKFSRELKLKNPWIAPALLFVTPWVSIVARRPWQFNTFSFLLECLTFFFYFKFLKERKFKYSLLGGLSLALYFLTGLDWPSFVFFLIFFWIIAGIYQKKGFFPSLLLPLLVVVVHLTWVIPLWLLYHDPESRFYKIEYWRHNLLVYPFKKMSGGFPSIERFLEYLFIHMGPVFLIAAIAAGIYLWNQRSHIKSAFKGKLNPENAIWSALGAWILIAALLLLKKSSSTMYIYIIGVPCLLWTARVLQNRTKVTTGVIALSMAIQLWFISKDGQFKWPGTDDRRVTAMAAYIIENHPELLVKGQRALLPRNVPANVGQYTRGQYERIIIPVQFPITFRKTAVGSDEALMKKLILDYRKKHKFNFDWVVFTDSNAKNIKSWNYAPDYAKILKDTSVQWVAEMTDHKSRKIWLGIVGQKAKEKKQLDTGRWADIYRKKYDRIDFLKNDLEYIRHY